MKRILSTALLALVLSACGPKAPPTIDPIQVQASAIAAASTMIAMTQAAIPTATEVPPPSPTPLPSPTLIPLPTLGSPGEFPTASLPTATSPSGQANCVHPLDMGAAGPKHPTVIINESGGTINLSLNLYKPNVFGECGSLSYPNVAKNDSVSVGLPSGYWYAYAWATAKGKNFTVEGYFYVQPAQSLKLDLCVRTENIVYKPQC